MWRTVLQRLDEMKDGVLNISGLGLKELPRSDKWKEVTHLDCRYNELTSLPDLPLVIKLNCRDNKLTSLSNLPLVTVLNCSGNLLTSLPKLPCIIKLDCYNNVLTSLPDLNHVIELDCSSNKLTSLPNLPLVTVLYCYNNVLTSLPNLPLVITLYYQNNKMLFDLDDFKDIKSIKAICRIRSQIEKRTILKVIRRWRSMLTRNRLKDVHTELKYSPDLIFYTRLPEAKHFFELTIESGWKKRLN